MFSGTGKMYYNSGNDIFRGEFPNGYAIYAYFHVVQRGNLAVDTEFSAAPTTALGLVCYGEFENLIQVDSERSVIHDYSG